jgi:peptidoglycan/LPS O-acetylase OafA/YrhL
VLKGSQSGALVWPTVANMLFIAQSGMLALEAPINSPFWSLNYEVWYYVIFAVWTFSAPKRRLSLTVLALVLAGPKIVLLLPVWLMGVWLQRSRPKLSHGAALVLFVVSWGLGMTMFALDLSDTIRSYLYAHISFMWRAHFSTQLVYDYLLGIAVTANFAAIAALPLPNWLKAPERLIRYLAGFTFSLYLFHVPLGELMYEVIGIRAPLPYYAAMAAGTFVLAQLTERRVRFYRALLKPRWRGSVAA